MSMSERTIGYYEANASTTARGYEGVDFGQVLDRVLQYAPRRGKLLDIGCGSGRDAAFFLRQGYDVTATDGSNAMLREADSYHPELHERLVHHRLPNRLPFDPESFDVVTSMAVIMHLREEDLPCVFADIARVARPDAIVAYTVNTARAGLDENGNDEKGRRFTCLNGNQWEGLHTEAGLETLHFWESDDLTGRPGIQWVSFVCKKG